MPLNFLPSPHENQIRMRTVLFGIFLAFFLGACKSDPTAQTGIDAEVANLEKSVAADDKPDPAKLEKMVNLYLKYVETYPDRRNMNVPYLMKAGEAARLLGQFNKAIAIYDKVITDYRTSERTPQAYFMKGYTYDNDLNKEDSARIVYEYFIKFYPNDQFTDDATFLLQNLGKSDEEMIEQLQEKADSAAASEK
jgi:tetratricopeptide (TPR) repeat protein